MKEHELLAKLQKLQQEDRSRNLTYYSDNQRHLVCYPYSIPNLHAMAEALGIKRCWFEHRSYAHYDIPKRRIAEIACKTIVVRPREILRIVKGEAPNGRANQT